MKKNIVKVLLLAFLILMGGNFIFNNNSIAQESNDDFFTELYRPQFHFSTPEGRLADPNGLIYFEGEYHLFHQKMGTWAHAVSPDLIHWEHLPVALEHDEMGQAMSGTAVIDWNDTSGLFDGEYGMVAIYTSTEGGEAQSIAYSKDNGRTWDRYEGNPVIENPGLHDFRDPKVFWHEETEMWVMVVSTDKTVTFYNSHNLIDWEYQSVFGIEFDGTEHGSHIAVWETPDLFPLAVDGDEENQKWVLTLSIGDNPVTDGSTNQYFIGEFDGYEFINDNEPEEVLFTDFGKDYYAGQSFNELEEEQGRRVWLGWMANWRYPYQSPTSPWMGSVSIPRELTLRTNYQGEIRLFQEPIPEIKSIRATENNIDSFEFSGNYEIEEFKGISYEFELVASWDELDEFGIRLRQSNEEETVIGIDLTSDMAYLDRTEAGLDYLVDREGNNHRFGKRFEADIEPDKNEIIIRGLVDESSVEIFIDDGETIFTNLIYSQPTSNGIELFANNGNLQVDSLTFYHLDTIWRTVSEEDELERIVVNHEQVNLSVGESTELIAGLKPDWFISETGFEWTVADSERIQVEEISNNQVRIQALKPGQTTIEVGHPDGDYVKTINVSIWDEEYEGYLYGWGPSPFHGAFTEYWDIIDENTVHSQSGAGQVWTNIYRNETLTKDFKVSSYIQWIGQGTEGFPKAGINIADDNGGLVSGFFNNDAHMLETNAEYNFDDIGWEGVELPDDANLEEPQKMTIERQGDLFIFYFNDEKVFEREIELDNEVSIGLINENAQADFTEFTISLADEDENEPEDDSEDDPIDEEGIDDPSDEDGESDVESDESEENELGEVNNDSEDIESESDTNENLSEDEKLPETATNTIYWLLGGLFTLTVGGFLALYLRRKNKIS